MDPGILGAELLIGKAAAGHGRIVSPSGVGEAPAMLPGDSREDAGGKMVIPLSARNDRLKLMRPQALYADCAFINKPNNTNNPYYQEFN